MLEVAQITKNYEGRPLLSGVSFSVSAGETVCLLGASGSGKSTLLRIISGLGLPDSGKVLWDGVDIGPVPVHRRSFGLMFQEYALFPHRNVAENVAFGLRMKGLPRKMIQERVQAALERVHMLPFASRRVTDLSGGEQQRVALARALAPQPRLLMLDEPLGALDRSLKEQLASELRQLLHEARIPAVYVTHDQEEAFTIADRLILLHDGQIEQSGVPAQVYAAPASLWVAQFLGFRNLLPGRLIRADPPQAETEAGIFEGNWTVSPLKPPLAGSPVAILLRPRGARLGKGVMNSLHAIVEDCVFREEGLRVRLRASGGREFSFYFEQPVSNGLEVDLTIPAEDVQFFLSEHSD